MLAWVDTWHKVWPNVQTSYMYVPKIFPEFFDGVYAAINRGRTA